MKKICLTIIILVMSLTFLLNSGEAFAAKNYRLIKTANNPKVFLVDNNRLVTKNWDKERQRQRDQQFFATFLVSKSYYIIKRHST